MTIDLTPLAPQTLGWPAGMRRSIEIGQAGLVLGLGTRLVRMSKSDGLALDADRDRLLALLSVADRRTVSADVLPHIAAAAGHWRRGDKALANLRLVFAKLPRLDDPVDAWRLRLAELLLDDGLPPRTLMTELDLDPTVLSRAHYNPDEPRVGSGNGTESGRWGDGEDATSDQRRPGYPGIFLVADQTTPGGVTYNSKIQRQMRSRGYTAEQIDEAIKFGPRIDAINKSTGGPAIRYVNPTTGQSVVIDSTSNKVLQVGRSDFGFGPGGGDVPGATLRPAPSPPVLPPSISEEPIIIPDVILPP